MIIGTDFEKIEFEVWGLNLLEPNALIGDTFIALLSFYLGYRTYRHFPKNKFFKLWTLFFVLFGFGFFIGGLGHTLYNYWGVAGKYFSWFCSILSLYFLETALTSIDPKKKRAKAFTHLSLAKLILCLAAELTIVLCVDLEANSHLGLLVPSLATFFSMIIYNSYLGTSFSTHINPLFTYISMSLFVMIPAAIVQAMRISFHPLMDRNDISHICVILMLILYGKAIDQYSKHLSIAES